MVDGISNRPLYFYQKSHYWFDVFNGMLDVFLKMDIPQNSDPKREKSR